jgi:hypothetical protein
LKSWPFLKRVSSPREATAIVWLLTPVDGRRHLTFGFLTQDSFLMEEDGFLGRLFLMMGKLGHFGL